MNAEITGKLLQVNETQSFGDKGFLVRTFVLETQEQYSQEVEIKTVQDKTSLIDSFKVGEVIKAQVNLKSRVWVDPQGTKKYFASFEAWRIEANEGVTAESSVEQTEEIPDNSNLPF